MLLLKSPSEAWPVEAPEDGRTVPPIDAAWRHVWQPPTSGGAVRRLRSRTFSGLTAVVKDVQIDGDYLVECAAPFWRLLVVLDEVGGHLRVRSPDGRVAPQRDLPHAMFLSPPGVRLQAFADGLRYVRQLSLQFDPDRLAAILPAGEAPPIPTEPRLGFFESRIYGFARLFELECARDDDDSQFGDSLTVNILSLLSTLGDDELAPLAAGGLTPRQLRRVTEHLHDHLADAVSPVDLARLLDMSRSHFCRAFKTSTGLPPHAWLMSLRIRRAREMMMTTGRTLVDIALDTGFADQPHFTRVFTRFAGMTPGEWRRQLSS